VRIDTCRVICREAEEQRAVIAVSVTLDSADARAVRIRTRVDDRVERDFERSLGKGANSVEWTFGIDNPELWWPYALGEQPLSAVTISVLIDDEVSHERTVQTGLRQVAWRNWTLAVNGERLFVKGANLGPTRAALAEATPSELARDVELAREAGLDLLRIHGHVTRPELYEAADRLGMLVWQDFPLQWGYARSVRRPAVRQAAAMVDVLAHHPSIVLWCGHNEPFALDIVPGEPPSGAVLGRYLVGQELPTWNKTILDRSVKRSIERADESRPVIAHSGVLPHPPVDGTDSPLLRLVSRRRDHPCRRLARGALRFRVRRAGRPTPPTSCIRPTGPISTGNTCHTTTPYRKRSSIYAYRRPRSPASTTGGTRRRPTKRW
jgi:beta-mannosidase